MKYTTKAKQDLEGIGTLTKDPLATYHIAGIGKKVKK